MNRVREAKQAELDQSAQNNTTQKKGIEAW